MGWWQHSRDNRLPVTPRYGTRSRLPDWLPVVLWTKGAVVLGDRLHFCIVHSGEGPRRSIEWKSYDWLIGHRIYMGGHAEREPSRFDDPDSYE